MSTTRACLRRAWAGVLCAAMAVGAAACSDDGSAAAPSTTETTLHQRELKAALLSPDLVWQERSNVMPGRHGSVAFNPGGRPIADWGFSHPCGDPQLVWPDESPVGVTGVVHGYGFATHTLVQLTGSQDRTGEQRAEALAATISDAASACSKGTTTVDDVRCANAVFPICVMQRGSLVSVFQTHYDDGEDYLNAVAEGMADSMDKLTAT